MTAIIPLAAAVLAGAVASLPWGHSMSVAAVVLAVLGIAMSRSRPDMRTSRTPPVLSPSRRPTVTARSSQTVQ